MRFIPKVNSFLSLLMSVCLRLGTVGDDKGAFAFVNILERGKAANTLPPPGMQIGGRQLRKAADRVIRSRARNSIEMVG